jgi:hypothetical protein
MTSAAESLEGTYLKPIKASELWRPKEPPRPIITGKSSQRIALMTAGLLAMASHGNAQDRQLVGRPGERPGPFAPPANPGERAVPGRVEEHGPLASPQEHLLVPRVEPEPVLPKEGERIWSALLLATSTETASAAPDELPGIGKTLARVFGSKGLDVLGCASKRMELRSEQWLIPNQNFWFNVKSEREANGSYLLNVQVYHDQRRLLGTRVRVGENSPLIIRGPVCSRGQLVFVVQVLP